MKVILTEHIAKIGQKNELVEVQNGYALNFLFPRKLAVRATEKNRIQAEQAVEARGAEQQAEHEAFVTAAEQLSTTEVTVEAPTNEQGGLYQALQAADIETALRSAGIEVPKEWITISTAIKETGTHEVGLSLGSDTRTFSITVKKEG